jgi:hypothetical protein
MERTARGIGNLFITSHGVEGLLINLENIALIKKTESSQGEWLHIFFNNGESTTIHNRDCELWNLICQERA